jgi:hypothetical protein
MRPTLSDPASVAAWVADRLDDEGIPYAIGGAVALAAHGLPRSTADVDISVFAPPDRLERLFDAVERGGCIFDRAAARAEVERIRLFTARCGRVSVDLFVSFHPHHHEALARRVSVECPDGKARWFLSAEDLAVHKLALFRGKDRVDLERLFAARGDGLDVAYVRRWIHAIAGAGDARAAALEDLARRFIAP